MSEQGPDVTIIDGNLSGSVVQFVNGEDENSVLDGFTLTNGSGELYNGRYHGGCIFCLNSSPTIINNIVTNGFVWDRGAGIACMNSSPIITNNTISGNTGSDFSKGGGLYCGNSSNPTISGNTISGNSAFYGGGIACRNLSNPTITDNSISGNEANSAGAIYCEDSSPTISDNTISGNLIENDGGGIFCNYLSSPTSPTITNNTITGNEAGSGGGIRIIGGGGSSPTISNNVIEENIASEGGGIYYSYSTSTIVNNIISGNIADGVIGDGGGIYCSRGSATITNNTISANSASGNGGGIYFYSADPTITNSIFWDNSAVAGSEFFAYSGSPVVTYCDVEGGWTGTGNIDAEPLFAGEDYKLQSGSPCIDTGDSTILDSCLPPGLGEERSDMGAYGGEGNCVWPERPVELFIEPDGPVNISTGDTLYFNSTIKNNIDITVGGDFWLSVYLPNSNEILIPEPLINHSNPLSGQIPPSDSLSLPYELFVPTMVDTGSYRLIGRIGAYPNTAVDERWLDFRVIK